MKMYSLLTRNVNTFWRNVRELGSHGSWLFSCLTVQTPVYINMFEGPPTPTNTTFPYIDFEYPYFEKLLPLCGYISY